VRRALAALAARDARVRVAPELAHAGIAAATGRAAALASGAVLALVDQDDVLPPDALLAVAAAFADDPALDLAYTDEDQLETWGLRAAPRFKPGPSPLLLLGVNYVMHLLALRRPLFEALDGLRPGFDGAQDHDLALRGFERARRTQHLRHVSYSWRRSPASVAGGAAAKPWAYEAGRRAVEDAVARRGLPVAQVRHTDVPGVYALALAQRAQPLPCRVVAATPAELARFEPALRDTAPELQVLSTHVGAAPAEAFDGSAALLWIGAGIAPGAGETGETDEADEADEGSTAMDMAAATDALRTLARFAAFPGAGAVAAATRARDGPRPLHLGLSLDRTGRATPIPCHGLAALCPREVATACDGLVLATAPVAARARALAGAPLGDEDVACLALASHALGLAVYFVPRPGVSSLQAERTGALELARSRLWPEIARDLPEDFFEAGADRFCPRHPLLVAAGFPPPRG